MSFEPRRSGRPPFSQGIGLEGKLYVVMYGLHVVGWSDLEVPIEEGRRAAGVFEAGPQYQLVKPIFDLYRDAPADDSVALARFVRARDSLRLTIYEASSLALARQR